MFPFPGRIVDRHGYTGPKGSMHLLELDPSKFQKLPKSPDFDPSRFRDLNKPGLQLKLSNDKHDISLERQETPEGVRFQVDVYDKDKVNLPNLPEHLLFRKTTTDFDEALGLYHAARKSYISSAA